VSPNPIPFLNHLRREGYHPRSDKHSNALSLAIVNDLHAHCPAIRSKGLAGELVYDLNFTLRAGTAEWNVDLVLGAPSLSCGEGKEREPIERQRPALVQIAIEIKSVMTEHRKAVKNRKRDLEAHHEHVHAYNKETIAGGMLVVNAAPFFQSPLRTGRSEHKNPMRLVEHCVSELRYVASRGGRTGYGLEARCAIVVNLDNENYPEAKFETAPPAPQPGDPLHYDAFIRTVCDHYQRRYT
jgi:hypothetical protein